MDEPGAVPHAVLDDKRRLTAARGTRIRLPTRESQITPPPEGGDHWWRCWGDPKGPGAIFRAEVRADIAALKTRVTLFNGGLAVISAVSMAILAAWLSARFSAAEHNAVKRADVESAIQRSAEMVAAKHFDDAGLLKQMFDKAQVQALPVVTPASTKVRK